LKTFNKPASVAVLRFCKREYIQAILQILMNKDFIDAYENGIVSQFADGIFRRGFLRIVFHSGDYPKK
jgi:hypothetical protein